jgi:hypothetical protein
VNIVRCLFLALERPSVRVRIFVSERILGREFWPAHCAKGFRLFFSLLDFGLFLCYKCIVPNLEGAHLIFNSARARARVCV